MAQPESSRLEKRARQALANAVADRLDTTGFPIDALPSGGTPHENELRILLAQAPGAHPDAPPTAATGTRSPTAPEPPELTAELDRIAQQYRKIVADGRAHGFNVAADNLQRFLDGTGGTVVMGVAWLRGFPEVTRAETTNEGRFEALLNEIANDMKPGEKRTLDKKRDRLITSGPSSELQFASGTSTLTSHGTFELSMIEDTVSISGTVHHHWHDRYDWHAGSYEYIPGSGIIKDDDALLLQKYRGGQPFDMVSDWDRSLSATIKVGQLWNTRTFTWTGP